ncbi:hypothetical protein RCZ04_17250 [Capnocytophaga sp. HP1101]
MNQEIFTTFQNKLKVGNRRGVHLNVIPGASRYKFDIARLSAIFKSLPERFILDLLTLRNLNFSFSIHDTESTDIDHRGAGREAYKVNEKTESNIPLTPLKGGMGDDNTPNFEISIATSKKGTREAALEKLVDSIENLMFQNEVITSEKGVNTLGFGFPILLRRDMSDGQLTAAPVLIWQVKIKPATQMNTWVISRNEDDPIYLNEVLINHLQNDSGVNLKPIPDEMLEDGKIDKPELHTLCSDILSQLKVTQNLDFLLNNYTEILPLKTKAEYEELLPNKGDAFIEKCGILSLFEVQKQNIINDYETLKKEFQPLESAPNEAFQSLSAIETDPSQQSILESLKSQQKILIQGPPGTGKSQTLTAILINALENKQKTLVVCEKQTALEVLYNALQNKGLGRYCTMIKDAIADRKFIVDAVRNCIDNAEFKKETQAYPENLLAQQVQAMRQLTGNINAIHHKLNEPLLNQLTWTDVMAELLRFENEREELDLSAFSFQFTEEEYAALTPLWRQGEALYQRYAPYAQNHLFNPQKLTATNLFNTQQQVAESFKQYAQQWEAIQQQVEVYKAYYLHKRKEEFTQQLSVLAEYRNEYELLTATLSPTSPVYQLEVTNGFFYKLGALFSSEKKQILKTQKRLQQLSTAIKALCMHRNFSSIAISDNLLLNKAVIADYSTAITQAQTDFDHKCNDDFAALDLLNYYDHTFANADLDKLVSLVKTLKNRIEADRWLDNVNFGNSFADFATYITNTLATYNEYQSDGSQPLVAQYEWFAFFQSLTDFQERIVLSLTKVSHWEASFLYAYYTLLLQQKADDTLNFNERDYADFKQQLRHFASSQKDFIEGYWNAQQRKAVKAFEDLNKDLTVANLYNKRKSEKHNRLPLRQIAMRDTDLFTTFFPIILTTPDACCNLFEGKNFYFDNVVFDEASQLKLEDNLPAMLKGKTVIIAGDEHQMPPSNYFSKVFEGTAEDEDDNEEEDEVLTYKNAMLNIESLLDYALEYQFSKNHLDFHYRSKHPYLIDFSNHAFYNARLRPLPSRQGGLPIHFTQVNGTFDDHINREEATEVLRILSDIQPREDGTYPSVGIATFNITQRNYIRKQILQKQNDPAEIAFREKIAALEQAGLFVKNLENIQGDERDIIILSVTYGKKKGGKFTQSFGPLNFTKGYKLLNVIITRAKEEIYVCNSIPEEFLNSYKEALAQEGANNRRAVLYAYLAYARAVSSGNDALRREILAELDLYGHKHTDIAQARQSAFKEQTYRQLQEKYPDQHITMDYEFGGYTIDILLEPKEGKPVAIECLSKPLYNNDLAYLEDLHKEKILQGAGFDYKRKWAK